jgi:hypothetical protein
LPRNEKKCLRKSEKFPQAIFENVFRKRRARIAGVDVPALAEVAIVSDHIAHLKPAIAM